MMGGGNYASPPGSMQLPQQPRKFFDFAQQHGSSQEGQNRGQGADQQVLTPVHQAYIQYALQAQKSASAMQSQHQAKMGMFSPASGKEQDMRMGNLKMQELMSMQAANQAQASSSKNSSEQFVRGEKQMEQGLQPASDSRSEPKPQGQQTIGGQMMGPGMVRPAQTSQSMQSAANNQYAMAAQIQAWVREQNIDLSQPANANLMAQLIPLMQSKMAAQQKANESSMGGPSSPAPAPKQQVSSPPVASENSPHTNSLSDVSGQSGSAKVRQTASPSPLASSSGGVANNANNIASQQFGVHGRENQGPPRPPVVMGNGMPPMHPPQPTLNTSQGVDQFLSAKVSGSSEAGQTQYLRQLNRSSAQSSIPSSDGVLINNLSGSGGTATHIPQQRGFTRQQLHVLKAQILAFRRLKVLKTHLICVFLYCLNVGIGLHYKY